MFKKISVLFISFLIFTGSVFAQQITKFAVVDTAKVYQAYFKNSAPVRNYESKREEFQNEVNKLVNELQVLHDKKLEYEKSGNSSMAIKTESQISQKTQFLNEYTSAKNVELESMKKSLASNDSFYKKLYDTLERIAENGGYSMILSLQQANGILWYSPSVDVTDQVISQLGL